MKKFYHPLFLIFLYLLIHFIIRISFDNALQVDDREQIYFGQNVLLGYPMPQPPLYSWISYIFFKIIDTSLFTVTLIKYLMIFLTFFFIWKIVKTVIQNKSNQYVAIYSFLLLPSFAWHMHQGFTHTIILGLAIVMTTYSILRIKIKSDASSFLLLGCSLGIGFMSKYSYIIFAVPLIMALILDRDYRKAIFQKKLLLTLCCLLTISLPHYYWLFENYTEISNLAEKKLNITPLQNAILGTSFIKILLAAIGFLAPFIGTILFIDKKKFKEKSNIENIFLPFFEKFFLIIFIAIVIFSFIYLIPEVKVRWLHPLLMLVPIWVIAKFESKSCLGDNFLKVFYSVLILLTFVVFFGRIAQNTIANEFGYAGRLNTPTFPTLRLIPQEVIENVGLIKVDEYNLGTHVLATFDEKPIIIGNVKFYKESEILKNNCLRLWDNKTINNSTADSYKSIKNINNYEIYYQVIPLEKCINVN